MMRYLFGVLLMYSLIHLIGVRSQNVVGVMNVPCGSIFSANAANRSSLISSTLQSFVELDGIDGGPNGMAACSDNTIWLCWSWGSSSTNQVGEQMVVNNPCETNQTTISFLQLPFIGCSDQSLYQYSWSSQLNGTFTMLLGSGSGCDVNDLTEAVGGTTSNVVHIFATCTNSNSEVFHITLDSKNTSSVPESSRVTNLPSGIVSQLFANNAGLWLLNNNQALLNLPYELLANSNLYPPNTDLSTTIVSCPFSITSFTISNSTVYVICNDLISRTTLSTNTSTQVSLEGKRCTTLLGSGFTDIIYGHCDNQLYRMTFNSTSVLLSETINFPINGTVASILEQRLNPLPTSDNEMMIYRTYPSISTVYSLLPHSNSLQPKLVAQKLVCLPGTVEVKLGQCEPCPTGFKRSDLETKCTICPGQTYAVGGTSCSTCPPFSICNNGTTSFCPDGQKPDAIQSACYDCEAGYFCESGKMEQPCTTIGTYCPSGTGPPNGTAPSPLDCPPGVTSFPSLQSPAITCDYNCTLCIGGGRCSEYETGALCQLCDAGAYRNDGGTCTICPSNIWPTVILAIVIVGVVLTLLHLASKSKLLSVGLGIIIGFLQLCALLLLVRVEWPDEVKAAYGWLTSFSIGFQFARIECSILASLYNRILAILFIPSAILGILFIADLVAGWRKDLHILFRSNSTKTKEGLLLYLRSLQGQQSAIRAAALLLVTVAYSTQVNLLLQVFQCTPSTDGRFSTSTNRDGTFLPPIDVLLHDPTALCNDSTNAQYRLMSIVLLVGLGLGLPIALYALLHSIGNQRLDSAQARDSYGTIYEQFHQDTPWFTSHIMLRFLFTTIPINLFTSPLLQSATVAGITFLYLLWLQSMELMAVRPYASVFLRDWDVCNLLDRGSAICTLIAQLLALLMQFFPDYSRMLGLIFLVLSNIAIIAGVSVIIVRVTNDSLITDKITEVAKKEMSKKTSEPMKKNNKEPPTKNFTPKTDVKLVQVSDRPAMDSVVPISLQNADELISNKVNPNENVVVVVEEASLSESELTVKKINDSTGEVQSTSSSIVSISPFAYRPTSVLHPPLLTLLASLDSIYYLDLCYRLDYCIACFESFLVQRDYESAQNYVRIWRTLHTEMLLFLDPDSAHNKRINLLAANRLKQASQVALVAFNIDGGMDDMGRSSQLRTTLMAALKHIQTLTVGPHPEVGRPVRPKKNQALENLIRRAGNKKMTIRRQNETNKDRNQTTKTMKSTSTPVNKLTVGGQTSSIQNLCREGWRPKHVDLIEFLNSCFELVEQRFPTPVRSLLFERELVREGHVLLAIYIRNYFRSIEVGSMDSKVQLKEMGKQWQEIQLKQIVDRGDFIEPVAWIEMLPPTTTKEEKTNHQEQPLRTDIISDPESNNVVSMVQGEAASEIALSLSPIPSNSNHLPNESHPHDCSTSVSGGSSVRSNDDLTKGVPSNLLRAVSIYHSSCENLITQLSSSSIPDRLLLLQSQTDHQRALMRVFETTIEETTTEVEMVEMTDSSFSIAPSGSITSEVESTEALPPNRRWVKVNWTNCSETDMAAGVGAIYAQIRRCVAYFVAHAIQPTRKQVPIATFQLTHNTDIESTEVETSQQTQDDNRRLVSNHDSIMTDESVSPSPSATSITKNDTNRPLRLDLIDRLISLDGRLSISSLQVLVSSPSSSSMVPRLLLDLTNCQENAIRISEMDAAYDLEAQLQKVLQHYTKFMSDRLTQVFRSIFQLAKRCKLLEVIDTTTQTQPHSTKRRKLSRKPTSSSNKKKLLSSVIEDKQQRSSQPTPTATALSNTEGLIKVQREIEVEDLDEPPLVQPDSPSRLYELDSPAALPLSSPSIDQETSSLLRAECERFYQLHVECYSCLKLSNLNILTSLLCYYKVKEEVSPTTVIASSQPAPVSPLSIFLPSDDPSSTIHELNETPLSPSSFGVALNSPTQTRRVIPSPSNSAGVSQPKLNRSSSKSLSKHSVRSVTSDTVQTNPTRYESTIRVPLEFNVKACQSRLKVLQNWFSTNTHLSNQQQVESLLECLQLGAQVNSAYHWQQSQTQQNQLFNSDDQPDVYLSPDQFLAQNLCDSFLSR